MWKEINSSFNKHLNAENADKCNEIAIDLKQIRLEGAEEKAPLNTENKVAMQLLNEKEQYIDENGKKQSRLRYFITVAEQRQEIDEEFIKKLQNSTEDNIFKKKYNFAFPAWSEIKEDGFKCQVGEILDYGTEKFAKCTFEGEEVLLAGMGQTYLGIVKVSWEGGVLLWLTVRRTVVAKAPAYIHYPVLC